MRLFVALYPPPEVVAHLAAAVDAAGPVITAQSTEANRVRLIPADRWHLTLAFYGEDDPERRAAKLERRVAKFRLWAPRLRFAGAGAFTGVLWIGVKPYDAEHNAALRGLVKWSSADPYKFHPHLTVARWSKGRVERSAMVEPLAGYLGPWWTPPELALVRSELGAGGPTYTVLHRVPLADAPG